MDHQLQLNNNNNNNNNNVYCTIMIVNLILWRINQPCTGQVVPFCIENVELQQWINILKTEIMINIASVKGRKKKKDKIGSGQRGWWEKGGDIISFQVVVLLSFGQQGEEESDTRVSE